MNHFDGHSPIQGSIGGQKDHTHSAAPELSLEPVLRSKRGLQAVEEVDGRIAHVRDHWGQIKNTPALRLGHTIGGRTIAEQPELDAPGLEKVAGFGQPARVFSPDEIGVRAVSDLN